MTCNKNQNSGGKMFATQGLARPTSALPLPAVVQAIENSGDCIPSKLKQLLHYLTTIIDSSPDDRPSDVEPLMAALKTNYFKWLDQHGQHEPTLGDYVTWETLTPFMISEQGGTAPLLSVFKEIYQARQPQIDRLRNFNFPDDDDPPLHTIWHGLHTRFGEAIGLVRKIPATASGLAKTEEEAKLWLGIQENKALLIDTPLAMTYERYYLRQDGDIYSGERHYLGVPPETETFVKGSLKDCLEYIRDNLQDGM